VTVSAAKAPVLIETTNSLAKNFVTRAEAGPEPVRDIASISPEVSMNSGAA
jgi:hypothetical protein